MKHPCKNCPFKRSNEWRGGWVVSKMSALMTIEESGNIFSCHEKHPDNHVYSGIPMIHNDCVGFNQMQQNMKSPNKFPEIANNFQETNPNNYNMAEWAKSENQTFKLLDLTNQL